MSAWEWVLVGLILPLSLTVWAVLYLRARRATPDPDSTTYLSRHDQNYTAFERRRDWT